MDRERGLRLRRSLVALLALTVITLTVLEYSSWAYRLHALEERFHSDGTTDYFLLKQKRLGWLPGKEEIEIPLSHLEYVAELLQCELDQASPRLAGNRGLNSDIITTHVIENISKPDAKQKTTAWSPK